MKPVESILDHVDGAVVCLEASTLRPTFVSAAARELVGDGGESDWSEKPEGWRRLFDPEDWPRIAGLCQAVASDGRRRSARHVLRCRSSGKARSFRTSVSRLPDHPDHPELGRLLAHMLDLTEEVGAGARISEESALRDLLRHAPLAAFVLDGEGVVTMAQGKGLERIGVDPALALGRSMLSGDWPCHWITENTKRVLAGESFGAVVNVDGGWLSVKYVPVRGPGGVEGALAFATDITECKRVVDLIGTIDAVIWQAHGADRRLSFVGGSAEKLLGESPELWLGRTDFFERHLVDDERDEVVAAITAVAADGVERTIAHRLRRADGSERWCRTTLRATETSTEVVGLMLDVTERHTIERALDPVDRRWQIVAEQAPVVVYTLDRDLRFTSGIGRNLSKLGLAPKGTLIGLPIEEYFHAPAAQPLVAAHRAALGGETVSLRESWRGRTYDVRLEPLRDDGDNGSTIMGVVGVAVDVTQEETRSRERERLLELERAAHAQADEAVQARDELFGIASHELRTPLAGLLLTLQAARASAPNEGAVRRLQLAERQAMRINAMIEELLDVSRLSAGRRLELEREDVDLALLTRQIVARFEPEIDASKATVTVHASDAVVGYWDRSRLDQVVTNLLSNALKYGRGRPVDVTIEAVRPEMARLAVRDYGVGIAPGDLGLLFHPFRRLHRNLHFRGVGLGLYIVAEIVRAHGGQIRVESEPNCGALFTVELPTARPAPA
jgi:PAS domain S-box-containing protein